jgi:endonuclease YncB( thermonuclease family)
MTVIKFRRRGRYSPIQIHRGIKCLVVLAALTVLLVAAVLQTEIDSRAPVSNSAATISAIDGDTVRANGRVYRLVGFDTPESGSLAPCERERKLADAAQLPVFANSLPMLNRRWNESLAVVRRVPKERTNATTAVYARTAG